MKTYKTDILILGSGGAGLFAALHAQQANPALSVTVAVKGTMWAESMGLCASAEPPRKHSIVARRDKFFMP